MRALATPSVRLIEGSLQVGPDGELSYNIDQGSTLLDSSAPTTSMGAMATVDIFYPQDSPENPINLCAVKAVSPAMASVTIVIEIAVDLIAASSLAEDSDVGVHIGFN